MKWWYLQQYDGLCDCHTEWIKSDRESQYYMLSLICGIWKNGTNELIYKTESQMVRTNIVTKPGWWEGLTWNWHICTTIYKITFLFLAYHFHVASRHWLFRDAFLAMSIPIHYFGRLLWYFSFWIQNFFSDKCTCVHVFTN